MKRIILGVAALQAACGDASPLSPDAAASPDSEVTDAAPVTAVLPPAPADWLLLFDRSSSWSGRADRFAGLVEAVSTFVTSRTFDLALAATSFPRAFEVVESCDVADFMSAEVPWPANDADVTTALGSWDITDAGSTLGPALAGAGTIASTRRAAHRGRSTSIVLLTDAAPGEDETCESSAWQAVAAIASETFSAGRGPSVHVVSVMGTAVAPDHWAKLGGIAGAGGGYAAFVNGGQSDVALSARDALHDLESRAATCTRLVPPELVPDTITVTSPDGTVTELSRVADASECSNAAFYLDDPLAPTTATLCSGNSGVGGICEVTFVRAQIAGAPTVTATGQMQ